MLKRRKIGDNKNHLVLFHQKSWFWNGFLVRNSYWGTDRICSSTTFFKEQLFSISFPVCIKYNGVFWPWSISLSLISNARLVQKEETVSEAAVTFPSLIRESRGETGQKGGADVGVSGMFVTSKSESIEPSLVEKLRFSSSSTVSVSWSILSRRAPKMK